VLAFRRLLLPWLAVEIRIRLVWTVLAWWRQYFGGEASDMFSQPLVSRDTVGAGFVERFVAVIIDGLVLLVPNIIVLLVLGSGIAASLVNLAVGIAYTLYFWTTNGATPGKQVMGLKVVFADGGELIGPATGIVSYIGYIISGIPLFLGYLWAIWDPKHEAWHDKIAGTKVIKVR
jgi:uncharacterized RDD family membrane protein YckC